MALVAARLSVRGRTNEGEPMSGWIKVEKNLETDPRVLRVAKALDQRFKLFSATAELDPCNAHALPTVTLVCGALTRLWMYADSHARDDDSLDMSMPEIDEWLGIPGFCELMPADWLRVINDSSVELPGYQAHNNTEAKKKALTNKRVARHRNAVKRTSVTPCNAPALPDQTKTRPRPDQTKPDHQNKTDTVRRTAPCVDSVTEIFDHWRTEWGHPQAQLDAKRRKTIQAALKLGYSVDDLRVSISGYRQSPHHRGENDRQSVYDSIDLLLRDAKHIDAGIGFARGPPAQTSDLTRHNVAVLSGWQPRDGTDETGRQRQISSGDGEPGGNFRQGTLPAAG